MVHILFPSSVHLMKRKQPWIWVGTTYAIALIATTAIYRSYVHYIDAISAAVTDPPADATIAPPGLAAFADGTTGAVAATDVVGEEDADNIEVASSNMWAIHMRFERWVGDRDIVELKLNRKWVGYIVRWVTTWVEGELNGESQLSVHWVECESRACLKRVGDEP